MKKMKSKEFKRLMSEEEVKAWESLPGWFDFYREGIVERIVEAKKAHDLKELAVLEASLRRHDLKHPPEKPM